MHWMRAKSRSGALNALNVRACVRGRVCVRVPVRVCACVRARVCVRVRVPVRACARVREGARGCEA